MADYSQDEVQERLTAAIPTALGEIVTSWTLVAETITDDGRGATWWMVADGQGQPTTLGHLDYVRQSIAAQMVVERLP